MHNNEPNYSSDVLFPDNNSPKILPLCNKFYGDTLQSVYSEIYINSSIGDWSELIIILDSVNRDEFSELVKNCAMFIPSGSSVSLGHGEDYPRYPELFFRIRKLYGWEDSKSLLWISHEVCGTQELIFAFITAHELQHVVQYYSSPEIFKINSTLLSHGRRWGFKNRHDIPYEYECDMVAKKCVNNIFYSSNIDAIIIENSTDKLISSLSDVPDIEIIDGYNLEEQTTRLIGNLNDAYVDELIDTISIETIDSEFEKKCIDYIKKAKEC